MLTNSNPLLCEPTASFGAPSFTDIFPEHFPEAFDEALRQSRAQISAIASNKDEPNFENTIKALETSGRTLTNVCHVFFCLSGAHTNPELQKIERDIAPKLAKHSNETLLNAELFKRIETLVQKADALALDSEQAQVLDKYHTAFKRAGAGLSDDDKKKMSAITERLAVLGTQFAQNMLADEANYMLLLESEADLAGLPDFLIASAAATAEERGHKGKYAITLSRSSIEPFLQFSKNRELREQAFKAWSARGENGGETDNREIIRETLMLRQERAKLLGFENFSAFKLDNCMAKTPQAVRQLLETVWKPAAIAARLEAEKLEKCARAEGENHSIAPWDWRYYAEKVRKAEFDLDEAELKPYLQLENIIQAAFETARRLFGLSFAERKDIPLYHPDVRTFEVFDGERKSIGLFVADYFARPSKRSGAWMSALRKQQKLEGDHRPIITNVMNFAKGANGEANLLTFDDARTLFHEFGHALHGLLSDVTYPIISGTSVARDFVELPSQLYEHWLSAPEILSRYAVHYKTGEPMPARLLEKLLAAENFNQGFQTVEYLSSALYDLDVHCQPITEDANVNELETQTLTRLNMPDQITMRHRPPHFAHVFSGDGYSSGYYSYMWSEVMDADAFTAFEETGDVFNPKLAEKLKTFIYSAGGRQDPSEAYIAFRGKPADVNPLLRKRGFPTLADDALAKN